MSQRLKNALFASVVLVALPALAADYVVVDSHTHVSIDKVFRIYTAIERAADGSFKFSGNFELTGHKYQVIGKRDLASEAEARQLEDVTVLQSCATAANNVVLFRFVVGRAASRYTIVDHGNRRWGEFPDDVSKCPPAGTEPRVWNPVVSKAP
jgi:hypothetical protein